jgi:hypothetical protein
MKQRDQRDWRPFSVTGKDDQAVVRVKPVQVSSPVKDILPLAHRPQSPELWTGRERALHPRYAALASHYTFAPKFCRPARGNEKPRVEYRVYDLQRRWVPQVRDLAALNEHLHRHWRAERDRVSGDHA